MNVSRSCAEKISKKQKKKTFTLVFPWYKPTIRSSRTIDSDVIAYIVDWHLLATVGFWNLTFTVGVCAIQFNNTFFLNEPDSKGNPTTGPAIPYAKGWVEDENKRRTTDNKIDRWLSASRNTHSIIDRFCYLSPTWRPSSCWRLLTWQSRKNTFRELSSQCDLKVQE